MILVSIVFIAIIVLIIAFIYFLKKLIVKIKK